MLYKRKPLFYTLLGINIFLFVLFSITNKYQFFTIGINLLSILILWIGIVPLKVVTRLKRKNLPDLITLIALFLLAFGLYIYKIDVVTPGIQNDEVTIAQASEKIFSTQDFIPFANVNYGHPTPLLYLTGMSMNIFGRTVMAIRLPYVLFGALSIALFYILLRMFFRKTSAATGALLMLFSYPFIILSRFAFEVTPEIFFQIATALFLSLAWKTKNIRAFAAIGLSLGAGLYTYVGFRPFALFALLLT